MINQICAAADPTSGDVHKHKCDRCGTCFKHSEEEAQATDTSFDEAHTCPNCGQTRVTMKLLTLEEKQEAMDRVFKRLFGDY